MGCHLCKPLLSKDCFLFFGFYEYCYVADTQQYSVNTGAGREHHSQCPFNGPSLSLSVISVIVSCHTLVQLWITCDKLIK